MAIINKLDSCKSPGSDNIGLRLVIYIVPAIINPLVDIFNKSFAAGIVPDRLKTAKVVPVYKKGDRSLPTNYRPISLLSILLMSYYKNWCIRDCTLLPLTIIFYMNISLDSGEIIQQL